MVELLVRPDDSPLRMNGSGLLVLNPPWQLDADPGPALHATDHGDGRSRVRRRRLDWLEARKLTP